MSWSVLAATLVTDFLAALRLRYPRRNWKLDVQSYLSTVTTDECNSHQRRVERRTVGICVEFRAQCSVWPWRLIYSSYLIVRYSKVICQLPPTYNKRQRILLASTILC